MKKNKKNQIKKNKCLHYWIIGSGQKSIAIGKCKKCKNTKSFINTYTTELNYSFRFLRKGETR